LDGPLLRKALFSSEQGAMDAGKPEENPRATVLSAYFAPWRREAKKRIHRPSQAWKKTQKSELNFSGKKVKGE
jgi:hypothetical protein